MACCFGLGMLLDIGNTREDNLSTCAERIERSLHRKELEIQVLLSDTAFIRRQLEGIEHQSSPDQQADLSRLKEWTKKDYNILFYRKDSLVYWLNNLVSLPPADTRALLAEKPAARLYRAANGYYEVMTVALPHRVTALALIPLKRAYGTRSPLLSSDFVTDGWTIPEEVVLRETDTGFPIRNHGGYSLAWLDAAGAAKDDLFLSGIFLLYVLGFVAAGMLVNDLAVGLVRRYQPWVGAAFVLGMVIAARWLFLTFGFAEHFASFQTFSDIFTDPILEGVNSLGELLINIILLVWLMVFFNREFQVKEFNHAASLVRFSLTTLNFFAINLGILMVCYILKSIVLDSSIVFDFENVFNLNSQSVLAMIGVVLLLLALFLFSHRMMLAIHKISLGKNWRLLALGLSILLAVPIMEEGNLNLPLPYFLVATTIYLIVFEFFIEVRTMTLEWLVICLLLYAGLTSMLLYKYNSDKDYIRRQQYALALADHQDSTAERSLARLAVGIDSLAQRWVAWMDTMDRVPPLPYDGEDFAALANTLLEKDKYLLYNYRSQVYWESPYDSAGHAEAQRWADRFSLALPTGDSLLRRVLHSDSEPGYLLRIPLHAAPGFRLYLWCQRSFSQPSRVYSELLSGQRYKGLSELDQYDYGIYQRGMLIEEYNKPYARQLTDSLPPVHAFRVVKHTSTRSELLYHAAQGIVIKIGRETGGYIKPLSLFSYVFTMLTIAVLILAGINYFVDALPGTLNFLRTTKPSLRKQFQFWVISMILFSFLGIGVVTVWYFQQSSNNYNKGRLDRKVTAAFSSVNYEIKHHRKRQAWLDAAGHPPSALPVQPAWEKVPPYVAAGFPPLDGTFSIASLIPLVSEVHLLDVNLYDLEGRLLLSSEQDLFDAGIVSPRMGAYAFQVLNRLGLERCDQEERIGNLEYTTAYLPVHAEPGRLAAFIGIPYYANHRELRNDVTDFMSTLLNVYVFLLLIAGGLAIFVANSVTKALSDLSENIQHLRLGGNQPISWKRKDEIGDLVDAYNRAVRKIEESSRLLAQSERENAWREMAQQVAHEIKNPLTPMKLSIQHLLRAYQSNRDADNMEALFQSVTNTLVEQIDALSQIATEFSSFARMPDFSYSAFSLNQLTASAHQLFRNERPDLHISIWLPREEYKVFADKNQIVRVLNNLLKNAIQAIPDGRKGHIQLSLYQQEGNAVVQVRDNGTGIAPDIQEKVFKPNFSTKTSGTGLGLAICKNIVEGCSGRIYFETEWGKGTSFYLELPLREVNASLSDT